MTLTKRDVTLLSIIFVFLIVGLIGAYSYDFLQDDKALSISFKWFVIPSVIIATYYAYHSTFGYSKKIKLWRNILSLLVLTLIFTLIILRSFQGYLIAYNCKMGTQTDTLIRGQVVGLDFPRVKKPLNKYSIEIQTDNPKELIKLNVPTNDYSVGQPFSKEMKCGSLSILYSN